MKQNPTNPTLPPRPRRHRVAAGVCALVAATAFGLAGGATYEHQRTVACHKVIHSYRSVLGQVARTVRGESNQVYDAAMANRLTDDVMEQQDRCGLPAADKATG